MNRAFAITTAERYYRRNFNSLQPNNIISRFSFTTTTKRGGLVYCISSNSSHATRHHGVIPYNLLPPVDHCHRRQHRYIRSTNSKDEESKMIQHKQSRRSNKTDPTAKRPTKKCDPYGLNGQSLSFDECFNLLSTLDEGWRIIDSSLTTIETVEAGDSTTVLPKFLQRQCYHNSFHEASKFLSYIAHISTNINHYPILTMERILVDDLNNIVQTNNTNTGINNLSNDDNAQVSKKKSTSSRKVKGWIFQSTISCSTYRPSSSSPNQRQSKEERGTISSDIHGDKGLTYHDFHLAMSIDIELNRKELKSLIIY